MIKDDTRQGVKNMNAPVRELRLEVQAPLLVNQEGNQQRVCPCITSTL